MKAVAIPIGSASAVVPGSESVQAANVINSAMTAPRLMPGGMPMSLPPERSRWFYSSMSGTGTDLTAHSTIHCPILVLSGHRSDRLHSQEARLMTCNQPPDFAEVYDTYIRQIYAYCLRRTAPADAQDVTADVFTVVWRRWADRPVDDEIVPWIYGIARNVLSSRNRSLRRQVRLTCRLKGLRSSFVDGPESALLLRAEHEEVLVALSKLSQTDQETLRLVGWEELTPNQVAGIFGVTRCAIDQRISRAHRRLRDLLGPDLSPTIAAPATVVEES